MQFLINFKGQDGEEISGTHPHGFGLNRVKEIRLKAECPNLPLKRPSPTKQVTSDTNR